VKKAGAVFAKKLSEWFEPYNPDHQFLYAYWKTTGKWDFTAMPDTIYLGDHWREELEKRMVDVPINEEVQAFVDELIRVRAVLNKISHGEGWWFVVIPLKNMFSVNIQRSDGTMGRALLINQGESEIEILVAAAHCMKIAGVAH